MAYSHSPAQLDARAFARIHALYMAGRDEALHHPRVLMRNRRRRMRETTALKTPGVGGSILFFTLFNVRAALAGRTTRPGATGEAAPIHVFGD